VLKVRRTYERVAGADLREAIDVDDHRAYESVSPSGVAHAPLTSAILIHPIPATVHVTTRFFHSETRMVDETYTQQVPHYETESYDCSTGFGTTRSFRMCTRPTTRYTSETKHRTVSKAVEVPDGACEGAVRFAPADQHVYLVQYTYQDDGACHLSCVEQIPSGSAGEFRNEPCSAAPPRQ
jgi:hypothetical protein